MLVTSCKARLKVLAGLTAAALVASSEARSTAAETLVSGFNGDLTSVFGTSWEITTAGWSTELVPALSEGTGALRVYHNTGWEGGIKLPGSAALAQMIVDSDTFELDIVTPYGINWRQLSAVLNMNHATSGWNQTVQIDLTYPTETAPFQHVVVDLASVNGKNWKALAQEWLNNRVTPPAPEWFELVFAFQGADNAFSADFNFDQGVDAADFMIWQQNYGNLEAGPDQGDANLDFAVDNADLQQWAEQFGRRQIDPFVTVDNIKFVDNTPVSSIPEPASLATGLVGVCLFVCGVRRRRRDS